MLSPDQRLVVLLHGGLADLSLVFEGGPTDCYEAIQVVAFNLSWLLNGREIATFLATAPRS